MFLSSLKRLQRRHDPRQGILIQIKLHPFRHFPSRLLSLIFHMDIMAASLLFMLFQHLQHKAADFFIVKGLPCQACLSWIPSILIGQHRIDKVLGFSRFMPFNNSATATWFGSFLLNPMVVTKAFFFPMAVTCLSSESDKEAHIPSHWPGYPL